MLSTIDRYIARQYLFNVIALLVVLFSFVVTIDVALNIDKFLESADRMMGDGGGFIRRMALVVIGVLDIWWPKLLQLFNYLIGLVLVAAMGFTLTQLARSRELVAILASGISLIRTARPILLVAAIFMVLKLINSEFVLSHPEVAPLLTRSQGDIGKRTWREFPVSMVSDASKRVFLAERFDPGKGEMENVHIFEPDDGAGIAPGGGRVRSMVIRADQAIWNNGGWDLTNPIVLSMVPTRSGENRISERGRAVSDPTPGPNRIVTDLSPETLKLKRFEAFSQSLSWAQISELLKTSQPEMRETLQRIRWSRISQVLSGLLALVITLPFFLTREPRNMLVQSLKCAPVGIISLIGGVLLSTWSWPGLPPGFGVFIPVLILIPIAVASVSWLKT